MRTAGVRDTLEWLGLGPAEITYIRGPGLPCLGIRYGLAQPACAGLALIQYT